jgi:hypothetical protein
MGTFRLPGTVDLPIATQFAHRQLVLDGDSEGTEALAALPVEAHGRLREGVAIATVAGLERLDPGLVEKAHIARDARIERSEPVGG